MRLVTTGGALSLLAPTHLLSLLRGLVRRRFRLHAYEAHLAGAMGWLGDAMLAGGHGVSYGYDLRMGFLPAYPETTGYIIPTFYDYAAFSGQRIWQERARQLADWEVAVQMPSGAVQSGVFTGVTGQAPAVFNTGQVMLGWGRAYNETGASEYLTALRGAGEWLVGVVDADGCWRKDLSSHATTGQQAYNVRVAWALALAGSLTGQGRYVSVARRNVDWVLGQQGADAWVESNQFYPDWPSLTHNIAYVMEGLMGSGLCLQLPSAIEGAEKIAMRLLRFYEIRGYLPGGFFARWKPDPRRYRCLTGDAQIAGVWLQFYKLRNDLRYLNGALRLLDDVCVTQNLTSRNPGIRGGIAGSFPLHGFYSPLCYVNWAAKFFADSLMAAITCKRELAPNGIPGSKG